MACKCSEKLGRNWDQQTYSVAVNCRNAVANRKTLKLSVSIFQSMPPLLPASIRLKYVKSFEIEEMSIDTSPLERQHSIAIE